MNKTRGSVAVATLALLSVVGCSREGNQPAGQQTYVPATPITSQENVASQDPSTRTPGSYIGTRPSPVVTRPSSAAVAEPAPEPVLRPRPATRARVAEREDDGPRYQTKQRSKKKSAAIIGGSAGAGAAIGALAGGGKGAAIGALAGGAGGLIYDRATAKKTERID